MENLKIKFLLPMAIFMIAIAAAFASRMDTVDPLAPEQGYIYENNICVKHGTCDNTDSFMICTDNVTRQVFGLDETGCSKVLYMNWKP